MARRSTQALGGVETQVRAPSMSIVALLMCFIHGSNAQQPVDWTRADLSTVRLEPAEIGNLSAAVLAELSRRDCTVPQAFGANATTNVVSGRFTSSDKVDIAVLCSRERSSVILVFRGGEVDSVDELASSPDRDYLQVVMPGEIGFSRQIGVATPAAIRTYAEAFSGEVPPGLDHEGIDDAFAGKASTIWYWHEDRWLRLQGSD